MIVPDRHALPTGLDWPTLLRAADRIGVRVFRANALGDLEHVTTPPKEIPTHAA